MAKWLWLLAGGLAGALLKRPQQSPPAPVEEKAEPKRPDPEEDPRVPQILEELVQEVRIKNREYLEQVARKDWEELAARQIAAAMQRLVMHEVSQHSLSSLSLPSDDYKGRIIGKEGRNLRQFESLTGVDLIIDDVPNTVTLSCFDPFRRELARLALERLIQDGRFQPQRIEEAVQRARSEMNNQLQEKGRQAGQNLKLKKLHPQLTEALGRLAFRTSYRQNVLEHSQEVAHLCGLLAAELGGDVEVAKRAGLLHDIGKGLTDPGPHAVTGAALCRRFGENPQVCHAVEAHHEDVPQTTLEATLVQVADAISAARPGARRENTQDYMQRMETLERLGRQLPGVLDCQVVQAGREIRVFVRPESADDEECMKLASQLAAEIGSALTRPGPVRVNVVRQFQASAQVD
ncbi:ribonuclease Y [bacterium]|nr:ribonuclease Y [bacterium]